MNKDVTHNVSTTDSEKLSLILTTVQSLTVRFDNADTRFNHVDSRLLHVNEAVKELREGQRELQRGLLQLQEGQERLLIDFAQLKAGQESLGSELREMRREMKQNFLTLNGKTLEDIRDLQRRVTRLEQKSPPNSQT